MPSDRLRSLRRISVFTCITALAVIALTTVTPGFAQQPPQNNPSTESAGDVAQVAPPVMDNLPPMSRVGVPSELTIPAGTYVTVRLMGSLSSDSNQRGDGFAASLEQPIVVDGWVVARRGQIAIGRVTELQKAGRVKGTSSMGVALSNLPIVDGRQLAIESQFVRTSAGTSKGRDALAVGTTTGVGAGIGGAVDGGTGAGIGAAAGAAAGIAGVLLTPGRPTVLPSETLLTFQLQAPVTVSTQRSAVAFIPVSQQDFASTQPELQQRPVAPAYPPMPAYPYAAYPYVGFPYWGGWGFYPGVTFVGYYGGYRGYGGRGHGGHWH